MKYVGSKNKLSKELVPIIQDYIDKTNIEKYIEPFVGGANIIAKIKCKIKVGCDIHKELIALLKYVQDGGQLPQTISKEEYIQVRDNQTQYPLWYVGLVGFCATYNAKYFGGYAGACKTKEGVRHYDREAIRNINLQRENLKDIQFLNYDFREIPANKLNGYLIYCDPPYRDTTKYATHKFPYDEFYNWCRLYSKNNIVLVSEYNMPEDFQCIWKKVHSTSLDKNNNKKTRIERLFTIK